MARFTADWIDFNGEVILPDPLSEPPTATKIALPAFTVGEALAVLETVVEILVVVDEVTMAVVDLEVVVTIAEVVDLEVVVTMTGVVVLEVVVEDVGTAVPGRHCYQVLDSVMKVHRSTYRIPFTGVEAIKSSNTGRFSSVIRAAAFSISLHSR